MSSENIFNEDDVLVLKKKLVAATKENQQLKVKLTKSQNDITKKDKQIEKLLDPDESTLFVRKAVYEHKVAGLMNMREVNRKLERSLFIKDVTIRKLENDLQIINKCSRLFGNVSYKGSSHNYLPRKVKSHNLKPKSSLSNTVNRKTISSKAANHKSSRASTSSVSTERIQVYSAEDDHFTKQHLSSITDNFLNAPSNKLSKDIRKKVVPVGDIERNKLIGTLSRDEFIQLESNVLDVLPEDNNTKVVVPNLQHEQNNVVDLIIQSSSGKKLKQLEKSRISVHPSESQQSSSLNNKRAIKNLNEIQSCKTEEKSPYLCTLSKRSLNSIRKKPSKHHEYHCGTGEE